MGQFFNVVSPFSTDLIDRVYVFKSNDLPALHVSKMLGYEKFNHRYRLGKYAHEKEPKKVPGERQPYRCFISLDDLPRIMEDLGRDPDDLKLVFDPVALPIKKRESSEVSLQKSAEPDQKKRDREEPIDYVRDFAKRYLAEHPEKAQKLIIDTIVKKKFEEIIKKLE